MNRNELLDELESSYASERVKIGIDGNGRTRDRGRIYLDRRDFICVKPTVNAAHIQFWHPGGPAFATMVAGLVEPTPDPHLGKVQKEFRGSFEQALLLCRSALDHAVSVPPASAATTGAGPNRWWELLEGERYWLETTDRDDIGTDLKAPRLDESGRENWRYSLVKELRPGDVVLHYSKSESAIIGHSRVVAEAHEANLVWGARGTFARTKGVEPYERPGWRVPIASFVRLSSVISISEIGERKDALRALLSDLSSRVKGALYFPFELSDSRAVRPLQGYMFKVPASFVRLFPALATITTDAKDRSSIPRSAMPAGRPAHHSQIGEDYQDEDETIQTAPADPWFRDPDVVDRGLAAHRHTQNVLARALRDAGLRPLRPAAGQPKFDLAWDASDVLHLVEVKSLTGENEEQQLRLGLGQILRYRQHFMAAGRRVVAVLAVERKPADQSWVTLCDEIGITLAWPETFGVLLVSRCMAGENP